MDQVELELADELIDALVGCDLSWVQRETMRDALLPHAYEALLLTEDA